MEGGTRPSERNSRGALVVLETGRLLERGRKLSRHVTLTPLIKDGTKSPINDLTQR